MGGPSAPVRPPGGGGTIGVGIYISELYIMYMILVCIVLICYVSCLVSLDHTNINKGNFQHF